MGFAAALRYRIGAGAAWVFDRVLMQPWFPLSVRIPSGWHLGYDLKRVLGRSTEALTFFDVGANVGQTTVTLRRWFPTATVHAFEPFAAPFAALQARTALDPKVQCQCLALGAELTELDVPVRATSELNTLVQDRRDWLPEVGSERIRVTTLDHYLSLNRIERVHLLKIDVQGYEMAVLEGARAAFAADRIDCVVIELGFDPDGVEQAALSDVHERLLSLGLRLVSITQVHRNPRTSIPIRIWDYADGLYAHGRVLGRPPSQTKTRAQTAEPL